MLLLHAVCEKVGYKKIHNRKGQTGGKLIVQTEIEPKFDQNVGKFYQVGYRKNETDIVYLSQTEPN